MSGCNWPWNRQNLTMHDKLSFLACLKVGSYQMDKVFIRINRMVSLEQAAAIFNIIKGA